MGILDSIVEWIATQIMNLLDLVTGSVLGALGCDMSTFLRYFPAAETLYEVFVAIAVGFILLNLVWQLFKNFGLGVGLSAEDPSTEQYMAPTGPYDTVQTVDGASWYRQYAQPKVEKTPYTDEGDKIRYEERIVSQMPPVPKRKDKI